MSGEPGVVIGGVHEEILEARAERQQQLADFLATATVEPSRRNARTRFGGDGWPPRVGGCFARSWRMEWAHLRYFRRDLTASVEPEGASQGVNSSSGQRADRRLQDSRVGPELGSASGRWPRQAGRAGERRAIRRDDRRTGDGRTVFGGNASAFDRHEPGALTPRL